MIEFIGVDPWSMDIVNEQWRRYLRRWKVERLFAWLHNFRCLVLRYEYHVINFLVMLQLGYIMTLLKYF